MIGFVRHRRDHLLGHGALCRQSEEHIGAGQRIRQRPRICLHRMRRFPLVHAFGAALIDHTLGVAQDQVVMGEANRFEQFEAGDAGGARAITHELGRFHLAAGQCQSIDQAGGGDDCGAVLVVMKHRDVEQFA